MIRVGILHNSRIYKIFNLFTNKKDDTLFLHTYLKNKESGHIKMKESKGVINISDIPIINFQTNKTSFHPSGIIHSTDKNGHRIKENDNEKSIAFSDINDCWALFSIYPKVFDSYSSFEASNKDTKKGNYEIFDYDNYPFKPCQFTVYLKPTAYDMEVEKTKMHQEYPSVFLIFKNLFNKYPLDIIIRYHQSSSPHFPSSQVLLHHLYRNDR